VAVPENYFYDPVTPEVRMLMDQSLAVFRALGAQVVPVTIPSIELANPMVTLIIGAEAAALHGRWLRERAHDYGKQSRSRLLAGLLFPATRYVDALNLRQKVLQDFSDAVFSRADLLHLPVIPMPIPTIAESDLAANPGSAAYILNFGHCTRPFNYLGLPAISVPAGFTSNGLPCGMQLVGRPFAETLLLQAARAYERETHWSSRAPAL
jgi:aspartyl-tRNA(Asn)/glutamyl-tRNA(Gln) amidotransferase subunit A